MLWSTCLGQYVSIKPAVLEPVLNGRSDAVYSAFPEEVGEDSRLADFAALRRGQ
jgi:hypothetical protein